MRRVIAKNVEGRVDFDDNAELDWPEQSLPGGYYKIPSFDTSAPQSRCFLVKWPAGMWIDYHNTKAMNYVYILEGEVEYLARKGGTVRLKAGDCIVGAEIERAWGVTADSDAIACVVTIGIDNASR